MSISNNTKNFILNHEQNIREQNYVALYKDAQRQLSFQEIGEFSYILYMSRIDPLKYLGEVPDNYMCGAPIQTYKITEGVDTIGEKAFWFCTKLKGIILPDSLNTIKNDAFRKCISLEEITIPLSVTSIGKCIFNGCEKLKDIIYKGTVQQFKNIDFVNIDDIDNVRELQVHCYDGDLTV